jgi:hypothetical protein
MRNIYTYVPINDIEFTENMRFIERKLRKSLVNTLDELNHS